jgi:hypothetical protein
MNTRDDLKIKATKPLRIYYILSHDIYTQEKEKEKKRDMRITGFIE